MNSLTNQELQDIIAKTSFSSVVDMAQELLVLRQESATLKETIKAGDEVVRIAERYTDMSCYCEDAVINNSSGICTPCELSLKIREYRTKRKGI
jgi:hypothetical protein